VRLPRLPWARREAAAIARTLRLDAGDVHEGGAASERLLKQTPLDRFAVLHLAAHARADEAFPDRSAVFLAPGDAAEDGWLQPAEIAALDLRGRLVVLSACDSATGFVLSGEGPLSLARAFFAAGADAVVATRWPLRDDDAAFVMDRFYRALRSGADAAAALHHARQDAIDRGLPAAAWAGLALLGDGRRPPIVAAEAAAASATEITERARVLTVGLVMISLLILRVRRVLGG
jgi:CHAT domain-containing protein